jgi:hypothetical protein
MSNLFVEFLSLIKFLPKHETNPLVASIIPVRIEMVVVLPAPL